MKLCIITPKLPPAIDGIGDYCRELTRHMSPCECEFLVLQGASETQKLWTDVPIHQFSANSDDVLKQLHKLDPSVVLLQYVGYGYSSTGAPQWLADGICKWKAHNPGKALVIMFHEAWPRVRPWQKTYWVVAAQKDCIRQLINSASALVTSIRANADQLRAVSGDKHITIIPIGSNFEGDGRGTFPEKNYRHLLVFGKAGSRLKSIQTHRRLLTLLDKGGMLDRIVLAGESTHAHDEAEHMLRSFVSKASITTAYNFPQQTIPQSVRECGLAIVFTETRYLLKSTAFHLGARLGQVVITIEDGDVDLPLREGVHLLAYRHHQEGRLVSILKDQALLHRISSNSHAVSWEHLSWGHIAKQWSDLLQRLESDVNRMPPNRP